MLIKYLHTEVETVVKWYQLGMKFAGFSEKLSVTKMCAVRKNHEKIIPLIVHPTNLAPKFNTIQTNKIVGYTKKGWVTQELLKKYMDHVFPFGNGLLVWIKQALILDPKLNHTSRIRILNLLKFQQVQQVIVNWQMLV
eukprot:NODE_146_length_15710_cov_0.617385.p5 type:complete len:138 gc:universal NODE_146_length_15710_cov_0.617385:7864-7451(-)